MSCKIAVPEKETGQAHNPGIRSLACFRWMVCCLVFASWLGCSESAPPPATPVADAAQDAESPYSDPVPAEAAKPAANSSDWLKKRKEVALAPPANAAPAQPGQKPSAGAPNNSKPVTPAARPAATPSSKPVATPVAEASQPQAPPYDEAKKLFEDFRQARLNHDWPTVFQAYLPGYNQETTLMFAIDYTFDPPHRLSQQEVTVYFKERQEILNKFGAGGYNTQIPKTYNNIKKVKDQLGCYLAIMGLQEKYNTIYEAPWKALLDARMRIRGNEVAFSSVYEHPSYNHPLPHAIVLIYENGRWGIGHTRSAQEEVKMKQTLDARWRIRKAMTSLTSPLMGMQLHKKVQAGDQEITSFCVSPDGLQLAVGFADKRMLLWRVNNEENLADEKLPTAEKFETLRTTVDWSPEDRALAVGINNELHFYGTFLDKWDEGFPSLQPQQHPIRDVDWVGEDRVLVGSGSGGAGHYELVEVQSGKTLFTKETQNGQTVRAAVSHGISLLAMGVDNTIEVFNLETNEAIGERIGEPLELEISESGELKAIALSFNAEYLAAAFDSKICQWQRTDQGFKKQFELEMNGGADFLGYTVDNARLIASGSSIKIIDVIRGDTVASEDHPGGIAALTVDGKSLITKGKEVGEFYLWRMKAEWDDITIAEGPFYGESPPDPDLQGEWYCHSATSGEWKDFFYQDSKWVIDGTELTVTPTLGDVQKIRLVTTTKNGLKTITLVHNEDINPFLTRGIYQFKDGCLEICSSRVGSTLRPIIFSRGFDLKILMRKPLPDKPVVEVKQIPPKFSSPAETIETYRLAMLHHDWATALKAFLPADRSHAVAQAIFWTEWGHNNSPAIRQKYYVDRDEMLKKHDLVGFQYQKPEYIEKLQAAANLEQIFADVKEFQVEHDSLPDPTEWEQMQHPEIEMIGDVANCYYILDRLFDIEALRCVLVLGKQDGAWGIDTEKTHYAMQELQKNRTNFEYAENLVSPAHEVRTWTSADGKFTLKAKLRFVINQVAHLEKEGGEVIKVPVAKLSQADQQLLAEAAEKQDE